jgi:hypothetical protein
MNLIRVLTALMFVATLAGCCHQDPYVDRDAQLIDEASMDATRLPPIDQAVIIQHTLYDYHFAPGKDALTEVGRHDLKVLADHFCRQGVSVNVVRGPVPQDLYEARLHTVSKCLVDSGIPAARVQLTQGMAGGPGFPGQWVVRIMAKQQPGAQEQRYSGEVLAPAGGGMSK